MLGDLVSSLLRALLSPFPDSFQNAILELGFRDGVFLAAAGITVVLFFVSIALAIWAFLYRAHSERVEREQADFEALIRPRILSVLAGDLSPVGLQDLVPPTREMEFLRLLLEYEDRMKGAEREIVQSIAKPHLWAAEREMYDDIPEKRALAVRCLGVLGLPDSEKFLLDALEDSSTEVALAAAYSLAERGGARYAIPILSHLHRFERWSPRYLGEMLAFMGEEVAPDLTALCLDEGKPAKVRAISADALRLIGYPDAADIAATILHQGEAAKWRGEREPRIAALRILALLGRPEHLLLIRRLAGDPDPVIREVSITALGALGTRVDLPLLIEEMGGPSPWVALEAARSIRSLQEIGEADGEIQVTPERISLFREVLGS